MSAVASYKLGKLERRKDPRTLRLATYLDTALPAPPAHADWISHVPSWPMYDNDRIGCCTIATAAHLVQSWTQYAVDDDWMIPQNAVTAAYSAVSGYNPVTGDNDNGAVVMDVLRYWRTAGIGGRKILAYVQVNTRDLREVRQAIHMFGGVYIGAMLPLAAQGQVGSLWQPTTGPQGRAGSWGGHAISVSAYTPKTLTCITWGAAQDMTWGWWRRYVDEAYAIVSVDQINRRGLNPNGMDVTALLADLRKVAS